MKANYQVVVSPAEGVLAPQKLLKQDWQAIGKKALHDLAPFAIVLIPVLVQKVPADWAWASVAYFVLGRLKDYFVYATKETTYKV